MNKNKQWSITEMKQIEAKMWEGTKNLSIKELEVQ